MRSTENTNYRLPCNHCGNANIIAIRDEETNVLHAYCTVCGAEGPKRPEYSWNDRIDALLPDEIRLTEKWASDICLRLERLEQSVMHQDQGAREDSRSMRRSIEGARKFLHKMHELSGNTKKSNKDSDKHIKMFTALLSVVDNLSDLSELQKSALKVLDEEVAHYQNKRQDILRLIGERKEEIRKIENPHP